MTTDHPLLTLDATAGELQDTIARLRVTPEFHRAPDWGRFPELSAMAGTVTWFCVLRAFPVFGARLCIGLGASQIHALLDACNRRTRHRTDLLLCEHQPARSNLWPASVEGHCRTCGRVEAGELYWSLPEDVRRTAESAGAVT